MLFSPFFDPVRSAGLTPGPSTGATGQARLTLQGGQAGWSGFVTIQVGTEGQRHRGKIKPRERL